MMKENFIKKYMILYYVSTYTVVQTRRKEPDTLFFFFFAKFESEFIFGKKWADVIKLSYL